MFKNLEALHAWTDSRLAERSARRRCPVTGTTVAEAWDHERTLLTPLPETWPEPFDIVVDRPVSHDALVNFEGRQYSVPFRFADQTVEVRGLANSAQILKGCKVITSHPRGTEGWSRTTATMRATDSTDRVVAPPQPGRQGRCLQELPRFRWRGAQWTSMPPLAEVAR